MAPLSKFAHSPFRNAALKEAHRETWIDIGNAGGGVATDVFAPMRANSRGSIYVLAGGRVIRAGPARESAPFAFSGVCDFDVSGEVLTVAQGSSVAACALSDAEVSAQTTVAQAATLVTAHPSAASITAVAGPECIAIVDFVAARAALTIPLHQPTVVQSMAWNSDGSVIATTSKDNIVRLFDPRSLASTQCVAESPIHHAGVKPSRVLWLRGSNNLITLGVSKSRDREISLWDIRSMSSGPLTTHKIDSSTGLLIPLYDEDSGLLFVAGKGETTVRTFEITGSSINATPTNFITSTPILSACLMHKMALNVMECEVARIAALVNMNGSEHIMPIPATVMRKNKIDFQEDLFPPTFSDSSVISGEEWLSGTNALPEKVSLNPRLRNSFAKTGNSKGSAASPPLIPQPARASTAIETSASNTKPSSTFTALPSHKETLPVVSSTAAEPLPFPKPLGPFQPSQPSTPVAASPKIASKPATPSSPTAIAGHGSFKFIQGTTTKHFDDLRSQQPAALPNECRVFGTTARFAAWAIAGPGGRVAVWPHARSGRLPVKLPCVVSGRDLCDFAFAAPSTDDASNDILYTLCDDGVLRSWPLSTSADLDSLETVAPAAAIKVCPGKSGFLCIHPHIRGLAVVSSAEASGPALRCWDIVKGEMLWSVAHPDIVFGACYSWCGNRVVSVCRDGRVRIWKLRTGELIDETKFIDGNVVAGKGARATWIARSEFFAVCGFGKANQREMRVFNSQNLAQCEKVPTEMSPSLITPFSDESLPIVFLVGKGESFIQIFYIDGVDNTANGIKVVKLSTYTASSPQIGVSFVPKIECDIRAVEVARCFRLTPNTVEQVSFKVPRLKKEYFQDDIFPLLLKTKSVEVENWTSLSDSTPLPFETVDLRPADLEPLSSVQVQTTPTTHTRSSTTIAVEVSEAQKKATAMEQMRRLALADESGGMAQDKFQGVEDDEWD
ncbi:Coronin-7 [Entophlyctis luteolus]|nr:Coronin-7 [Entophlyctis luteolus]